MGAQCTVNNISVTPCSQSYYCGKLDYADKTTDLVQVNTILYFILLFAF